MKGEGRPDANRSGSLDHILADVIVPFLTDSDLLDELDLLGAPLFPLVEQPSGPIKGRYAAPRRWSQTVAGDHTLQELHSASAVGMVGGALYDVIDVDPRNGGDATLADLAARGLIPPVRRVVQTPSGGWHLYVVKLHATRDCELPGIDLQGPGRMVLVPPTRGYRVLPRDEWPELGAQPTDAAERLVSVLQPDPAPTRAVAAAAALEDPVTPEERGKAQAVLAKAIRDVETSESGRNITVARVLGALYNFTKAEVLDRDEVDTAVWEAAQAAPGGHPYDRSEFDATCASIWSKATAERPQVDAAADDFDVVPADEIESATRNAWQPVDMAALLAGHLVPLEPTVAARTDGLCLFYAGRTHSLSGESGSGKSWIAQWSVAGELRKGNRVLYLDYESNASSVVARLRQLGCTDAELLGLTYVNPDAAPRGEGFEALLAQTFTLAVIDGVTAALGLSGLQGDSASNNNDLITKWHLLLPERLAQETEAAVVQVDHVTKAKDGRGGYAIGGQAKRASITGAAYIVEPGERFGRGKSGTAHLSISKDREGAILGALDGEAKAAGVYVALVAVTCPSDRSDVGIELHAPKTATAEDKDQDYRQRMADALAELDDDNRGLTKNGAAKVAGCQAAASSRALDWLVEHGYASRETTNSGQFHRLAKPYPPLAVVLDFPETEL